jgi:hypothetical protein
MRKGALMRAHVTRRTLPIIIAAILVIIGIGTLALRHSDALQLRYFPETGHVVRDPFLAFFEQHGGVSTFGFPLTDAYTGTDGTLVQTFQRAQLQLTVRGVELAPIGLALRLGDDTAGIAVAKAFADFYAAHGGDAFFGPPLNAAHRENGLLIQDFEKARLVHEQTGEVRLANLGSAYLVAFPPPNDGGQAAFRLRGTPTPPPAIRLNVSVERPTVEQGGQQTIYLYVEDNKGNAVAGAQSLAILRYDGAVAEVSLPNTDWRGFSSATFIVPPAAPGGQVLIEMRVLVGEVFLTIETTYFQWW